MTVLNDIRYALRLMRRSPGFTVVAVLSLSLGIGANTAIFSLFYTIMLRPLPVTHPEQLVELVRNSADEIHWAGYWGGDRYEYFRDHNHVFSGLTGMGFDNLAAVRLPGSETETLVLEAVPGNYFRVLGLQPAIGRFFAAEDAPAKGEGGVAVVSWSYWNRELHRDPAILGQRIFYKDAPKTIVGVAPREYVGLRVGNRTDIWMPVGNDFGFTMVGRLKPGVSIRQAEAEIQVLYMSLPNQRASARNAPARMELLPAGAGLVRVQDQFGKPLVLLLWISGGLLLLACINLAGMLLARSAARQREIAVRVGLGASRGRLVRQMLTESLLLSGAGTLAAIVVAHFATEALSRILAGGRAFERVGIEVRPDLTLLLFTAGTALLTGLLFGLAPAWQAFRPAPSPALRQTGRGGDTWFWRSFARGLVTAQVALSILLVTAAAIFLSHLTRLRNFDLGFQSDHVLLMTLDLDRSPLAPEEQALRYRDLLARIETIPQIRSASVSGCTPLQGCGSGARYMTVEGHRERSEERKRVALTFVAPRYFETLGIPLIAGRDFSFGDAGHARVAIVNQTMARRYFSGENPIGKRVTVERDPGDGSFGGNEAYEIVGLAGDIKTFELRDPPYPVMYFNMFQENRLNSQFVVRAAVDPSAVEGTVRQTVRDVLKTVPVKSVTTLADQVDSNIVPEHLISTLSDFFGCVDAALAGVGLYGLLAYWVVRRTNEIGIRMALGATARGVGWLVLREATFTACGGLVTGCGLVLWSRPLAESVLPDLKWTPGTPLAFGAAAILAIALLASYIPAHRAARVDPMIALRHE